MGLELIFRLVGMVVFAVIGAQIAKSLEIFPNANTVRLAIALSLSCAALGLLVAPWLTTKPYNYLRHEVRRMPASRLVAAVIGLAIGLAISALLAAPLSRLPQPFHQLLPLASSLFFGYLGIAIMVMRHQDIYALLGRPIISSNGLRNVSSSNLYENVILVDSSAIIDGRIADISQTGFLMKTLLVPRFVLNEVQYVSDSSDTLRRNRGRRGLEILNRLQEDSIIPIRITDRDIENVKEIDDKLVMLAKQFHCPVLTTDYNLNRVAKLQGVMVLNINDLANAVKNVYLPGESLTIRIIHEGTDRGQGVGYLEDGTMVVVENSNRHINRDIEVSVTKVLQTSAGRMIFAKPEN